MTHDALKSIPLSTVSIAEIVAALNRCYEGYAIPVHFTVDALLKRISSEHIDLTQSALILDSAGAAIGCMLIARRGRRARIAALGIAPQHRGSGTGGQAVRLALDDARTRSDRVVILEVLTSNAGARRLYERCGFSARRTLVGYERDPQPACGQHDRIASDCEPERVLAELLRFYPSDVSWQIDPQGLAGCVPPVRAFRSAAGGVALIEPAGEKMRLLALAVPPEQRRRGQGGRLLLSILDRFPDTGWIIPAMVPEGLAASFLLACGFRQSALTQVEMEAVL